MNSFKLSLFFILLCLTAPRLLCTEVRIPLANTSGEEGLIPLNWDKDCFVGKDSFSYHHDLARALCVLSESSYWPSCSDEALSTLGFTNKASFYDIDYTDPYYGYDQCAFSFALLKDSAATPLVLVLVRGTPFVGTEEWISNTNIADSIEKNGSYIGSIEHEGFKKATELVEKHLEEYLKAQKLSAQNVRFAVTGHSRGAAVANLLSAHLVQKGISAKHIFAYTFACPNVSRAADVQDKTYGFIWNIVSQEDLVPTVPFSSGNWGYKKYGNTLAIISAFSAPDYSKYTNDFLPRVNKIFSLVYQRNYVPFTTGNFIPELFSIVAQYINGDIKKFYSGFLSLHGPIVNTLSGTDSIYSENDSWLLKQAKRIVEKTYPGLLDTGQKAVNDMHEGMTYVSFLLALEPNELYSAVDCYILTLRGSVDAVITNAEGAVVAKIINGSPESVFKTKGLPTVKLPSGTVCIGFPGNRAYHLSISDVSIANTGADISLRTYDGSGTLKESTSLGKLRLSWHSAYEMDFYGSSTAHTDPFLHTTGSEAFRTAWNNEAKTFLLRPKLSFNSALELGAGIQAGFPHVYGLFELCTNKLWGYDSLSINVGFGLESDFSGAFSIGLQAKWKSVLDVSPTGGFAPVPNVSLTFSYQPRWRFEIFAEAGIDWHIAGWNDKAFDSSMRPFAPIGGIYPVFQIGFLF